MKKMVQFFKSKRLYRYSFIAAAILVSAAVVYAATVPYTFTSGTVASSSEVNANFSYLADRSWEKSGSNLYYSSGNVGIGTTSPGELLHVEGSDADLILRSTSSSQTYGSGIWGQRINGASAVASGNELTAHSGEGWDGSAFIEAAAMFIEVDGNVSTGTVPGRVTFRTQNTAGVRAERMRIDNSGNVGIGTTSPSYPLHMASGAYVTTGGVWTNASSRTYKEHIAELSSNEAISAFQSLKPVTYNYRVDKDEKHIGFIAEDVPAILATKDRKGVSSMDVVALLTKVVQEQQKTITELKKEVEGMKKGRM